MDQNQNNQEDADLTKQAVRAYHDATTHAEKVDAFERFPILKKIYSALNHPAKIGLLLFLLVSSIVAYAGSAILIGSMVTVNGTTNSAGVQVSGYTLPGGYFMIQNGGLTATNSLSGNVQISFDNTNFYSVSTYWPSKTNATTEIYSPNISSVPVYIRLQIVTTNAVQVGAIFKN